MCVAAWTQTIVDSDGGASGQPHVFAVTDTASDTLEVRLAANVVVERDDTRSHIRKLFLSDQRRTVTVTVDNARSVVVHETLTLAAPDARAYQGWMSALRAAAAGAPPPQQAPPPSMPMQQPLAYQPPPPPQQQQVQRAPLPLPPQPPAIVDDNLRGRDDVAILLMMVESYFEIVRKTIADTVPKVHEGGVRSRDDGASHHKGVSASSQRRVATVIVVWSVLSPRGGRRWSSASWSSCGASGSRIRISSSSLNHSEGTVHPISSPLGASVLALPRRSSSSWSSRTSG